MDITSLADPKTLIDLLTPLFGSHLAQWITALMIWQSAFRLFLKPFAPRIQDAADKFRVWITDKGNTDLFVRVQAVERRAWVRLSYWLIDYIFSIKLGPKQIQQTPPIA